MTTMPTTSVTPSDVPMVRVPRSAAPVPTPARLRSVRLPLSAFIGTAAVLIPALILASIQLGWFGTTGRIDPATGQAIAISADSTGEDIRGWMTLTQLLTGLGVTRAEFEATFPDAAGADGDAKLGELSEAGAFELEAVRTWLDARNTPVPASGATSDADAPITPSATPSHVPTGTPSASSGEGDGEPPAIRGRTTVQEVLEVSGAALATFIAAFDLAGDVDPATRLVDLTDRNGSAVAIEELRAWVEAR